MPGNIPYMHNKVYYLLYQSDRAAPLSEQRQVLAQGPGQDFILDLSKARLDGTMSNLIYSKLSLPVADIAINAPTQTCDPL